MQLAALDRSIQTKQFLNNYFLILKKCIFPVLDMVYVWRSPRALGWSIITRQFSDLILKNIFHFMKYPVLDMVCHAKEPKSSDKINPNQTSFCLNINKRVFMKHPVLSCEGVQELWQYRSKPNDLQLKLFFRETPSTWHGLPCEGELWAEQSKPNNLLSNI